MATRRLSHKCEYNDLDIVYVTDFYDFALAGLCLNKDGELCAFEWVDFVREDNLCEDYYHVFYMTPWQKLRALFDMKLFEFCVSKQYSYKKNVDYMNYAFKKPTWFWKALKDFYFWVYR